MIITRDIEKYVVHADAKIRDALGLISGNRIRSAFVIDDNGHLVGIMTDGDFNTIYHDGVIAKNSGSGSGADEYKIDANATNGTSFEQADNLCDNIKAEGVVVYTVGLGVASFQGAQDFVNNCATSADHVYLPSTGTELKQAFRDIAVQVSNLRISM